MKVNVSFHERFGHWEDTNVTHSPCIVVLKAQGYTNIENVCFVVLIAAMKCILNSGPPVGHS